MRAASKGEDQILRNLSLKRLQKRRVETEKYVQSSQFKKATGPKWSHLG